MQNQPNICPQCHSPIPADAPGGLCPACVLLGVAGRTNPSQAAAAAAPTMEEVAAAFPELEVIDILGQGGMGVVFKARQPRLDRVVALKVLPPALAAHPGFAERFTREARVLARLAHPNIVSIYDFGESAGFYYLIMEFVNGVNLRAAMQAGVTPEQALLLVPRICEALQFAHDHGVLHRDIKPENILLDTAGVPKLADFGIAKLAGEESGKTGLTETGHALGTAAYMAPEQVEKPATVDHRADIYSLGVVFYEMLTGELPLGRFAAPSEKSPVDRGVDDVVMRALEKERERRQQSAKDFKTQVEGASHPGVRAPGVPPAARPANSAPQQDNLLKRILLALCALSGVGIPLTGMMGWDEPAPRHMVMFTILFGTLAGLSNLFGPEIGKLVLPRAKGVPEVPDPSGKGRRVAIAGLRLMLFPLGMLLLAAPWLSQVGDRHQAPQTAFAVLLTLAGSAGVLATLAALFVYRFRAPWFFFCSILATMVAMYAVGRGHRFGVTAFLGFGVIGYCIFHFREFFPKTAESATTATALADPAPNPWSHRLFWLGVSLFVLPVSMMLTALFLPAVSRHGFFSSLPFAILPVVLPFLALVALYFGYQRTQPGAERATLRATWNPWPKRFFILVLAVVVVPMTLLGLGIAIPMVVHRGAAAPVRPPKLHEVRDRVSDAAVVTAERAPFIGRLRTGTIELVSIANHPSGDQLGWEMDGSPAKEGPFINRRSTSTPMPGERAREFVFRVRDVPPDASTPTWQVPGSSGPAGGAAPELAAQPAQNGQEARPEAPAEGCRVIAASFPASSRKATVRVGIATRPWETLRELVPGSQFTSSFSHGGEDWAVTQNSTLETRDDQLVASYACPRHENFQTRVVAVTTAGQQVASTHSSQFGDQAEYRFDHLPLAKVKYFRFQARRYDWVEFRDVALEPSSKMARMVAPVMFDKTARTAAAATFGVQYNKVDSLAPGIYEMILNARTPTGWVTDYSFHIRDQKGEREIPAASFILARDKSPNPGDEFPGKVSWQFTTRNMPGYFQVEAKALPGSAGIASSSTSVATSLQWELDPGRSEASRTTTVATSMSIPFLRSLPSENAPGQKNAEIFVIVSPRPMRPGEKTQGQESMLGEDRFDQIATESLRQEDAIQRAKQQLDEMQAREKAGIPTPLSLEAAERDLAIAEAHGDKEKIAKAELKYAEAHLAALKAKVEAGHATPEETVQVGLELKKEREKIVSQIEEASRKYLPGHPVMKELQGRLDAFDAARAGLEKARGPAAPAPSAKPAPSPEITRLQDENIRAAREQLEIMKKRAEAGVATLLEVSMAERNVAVAEARDDELKAATALVAYAEARSKIMEARTTQGNATPLECIDALQELNNARIRLEKARAKSDSKASPDGGREAIGRLRDENIRLAREQVEDTKKRVAVGVVSPDELVLAERNLAVAEARDDELKTAAALVAYAETRFDLLTKRVQSGAATATEAADAQQELNTARIRLEEARAKAGNKQDAVDVEKPAQP